MRFLRTSIYLLYTALRSLRASWGIQLMTWLTLTAAVSMVGGMWLAFANLRATLSGSRGHPHVSVYLRDDAPEKTAGTVVSKFCDRPLVRSCEKVTAGQALTRFVEKNPEWAGSVTALGRNPFPASVEIELIPALRDREEIRRFSAGIRSVAGVEDVDDGGGWLDRWLAFLRFTDRAFWILGLALSLAMVFVVAGTIKLVVHSRRDEVEVLSLVGATPFQIRLPFLLEGFFQGAAAGAATLGVLRLLVWWFERDVFSRAGGFFETRIAFLSWPEQAALLLGAGVVGLLGSAVATGKFLRL